MVSAVCDDSCHRLLPVSTGTSFSVGTDRGGNGTYDHLQRTWDAIIRIGRKSEHDIRPVLNAIETGNYQLIKGALQAMAMLRMVPKKSEILKLIRIAELPAAVDAVVEYPNDPKGLRQWVAAAAAGWNQKLVQDFMERCICLTDDLLCLAAQQSLKGKYVNWGPY